MSFHIDTDWKLGLIGRNGKGKTTFLKLLQGKYAYKGTISKNVDVDYFPCDIPNKDRMSIEIVHEIAPNAGDWEIIKELNLLNTDTEILYRNFNLLSGGEQVKILLISLFLKGNNFLLIDEPTNHLDRETRENLVHYLEKKKGFILVSHDRNFLDKVVNHIIAINNTNIEIQQGNFSSWKENKDRQDNFEMVQNERLQKDINRLEIFAISLILICYYSMILPEDEQNRVWSVAFLMKGGDAYVIRTSLFGFYIHTIYRTCNSNCCRYCLICGTCCYDKKIRQRKKHISVWSIEICF